MIDYLCSTGYQRAAQRAESRSISVSCADRLAGVFTAFRGEIRLGGSNGLKCVSDLSLKPELSVQSAFTT